MDGGTEAAAAASVAAVLGNDDLLREILLRLVFPTTLVRAALVSKRWLRHSSDPALLRRFRALHPPRLLGFYLCHARTPRPQFVHVAPAPELATAVRRAGLGGTDLLLLRDCRSGRLLVRLLDTAATATVHQYAALSPLHPARGAVLLPSPRDDFGWAFLPRDGDGVDGIIGLSMPYDLNRVYVQVFSLRSCKWELRTQAAIQLPQPLPVIKDVLPPVHGKIYMTTTDPGYILVLDLSAGSFSVLQLPDSVSSTNFRLSCGEDSGLSVIYGEGPLLYAWHRETDDNGTGHWVLVHCRVVVCEAYNCKEAVSVLGVDENAEFVLVGLEESGTLVHMHLKSRTEKVIDEINLFNIHTPTLRVFPFMTVWPPSFPALMEDGNQAE